jgi:tetratricopeptide (TPR) repeat protein
MFGGSESVGQMWWNGAHDRALPAAQRESQFARHFRNFGGAVVGNLRLGQIHHSLGQYSAGLEPLRRNVALLEPDLHGETFGLVGLPAVISRAWLAMCLVEDGDVDGALGTAEEAISIARDKAHPFSQVMAYGGAGIVHALRGEPQAAIAALEPALVMARMADLQLLVPFVATPLGWCYAVSGRPEEGVRLLRDGVEAAERMTFVANQAMRLVWLADGELALGDVGTASRSALRALETARRHGERGHEAYALRMLGRLADHSGATAKAVEHYQDALAMAEELGMRRLGRELTSCLP